MYIDCLKVIESEGGVSLVPATINDDDTHTTVTKPQQSLSSSVLPADNLPATSNTGMHVQHRQTLANKSQFANIGTSFNFL